MIQTMSDLWAPTQSPQTMPDGPGESFEMYRAKFFMSAISYVYSQLTENTGLARLDGEAD